eukprot:Tamp_28379.p4 GENE.Tamp_28379~~Tamp_28379.p4  ORF type:complete len:105 (-),score=2.99 Tamp_28379:501-815(-)
MPGWAWHSGHTASYDDGRGAGREQELDVLCGRGEHERDSPNKCRRHRVDIGDGARVELGFGGVHGAGSSWADGMRGDGVGVGDVGAVSGGAWCSGHSAIGDDGW